MGQDAVRRQMDMRIGHRGRMGTVTDRGGQVLATAWHSCTHNASGNFVVATAEHDTPQARSKSSPVD
jgi:hypothetical protein